eukprot:scaffold276122_cov18-Prasinocladus_malaysianus.AAC.1
MTSLCHQSLQDKSASLHRCHQLANDNGQRNDMQRLILRLKFGDDVNGQSIKTELCIACSLPPVASGLGLICRCQLM